MAEKICLAWRSLWRRDSIHNLKAGLRNEPVCRFIVAIAEPSVWELVIGGAVSLVFLAVFLRMKLG
jgi:hypothetical protein